MKPKAERVFTADEQRHDAGFVDERARVRPRECTREGRCWVRLGRAGWDWRRNGHCVECNGLPMFRMQEVRT
jgi:hypothetical protein